MQRATALTLAKVAGYHNDSRSFTRLIIESRVARPKLTEAWQHGVTAKRNGVRCDCRDCRSA